MKVNIKKIGVEAEADVERIIEKSIDKHEENWKEKYNAKKEILELKHKYKMEEQNLINNKISTVELEHEKLNIAKNEKKFKKIIKITSIILFFIYGLFCIVGFKDSHTISGIISLVQVLLVTISIFSSTNLISLFNNDYKICFIGSIMLIIPWLAFAI